MLVVKVSGVKRYKDRHGKARAYHRASGTPIDPSLKGQDLALEVARLDKLHKPAEAKAGTLGGLLESYKKSPRFTDKADRTKADYRKIMDYLQPLAGTPLVLGTTGWFAKLRDKTLRLKRAGFTNHMLAMLSSAFEHGKEYDLVDQNPIRGLAKAKMRDDRRRPNLAWTPEERENVAAVVWPQIAVAFVLARYFGLRDSDIVKLPKAAYRDGWLHLRAGKNGALIELPVIGRAKRELDAAIEAAPKGDSTLLCLNTRGKPWTKGGFDHMLGEMWRECRGRGLLAPRKTLHGLRHSVGAELRGAGYTAEQRKLWLGHDTDDMAEHYSGSADVRGQLIDMANVLQARPKRERKLSTPRGKHV